MSEKPLAQQFTTAQTVADLWSLARQLMATRQLSNCVDSPDFLATFDRIASLTLSGTNIDRLLAIDLLVRLPAASKKLADRGTDHLRASLTREPPTLNLIASTVHLPEHGKPADIRENIALGLAYATGDWVEKYLLTSIVNEQQSQRTREVLVSELVGRLDDLGDLLHKLSLRFSSAPVEEDRPDELLSVCGALIKALSQNRQIIMLTESCLSELDVLAGTLVKYSGRDTLPQKLEAAAIDLMRLFDELLTMEISLFVEPDSYLILRRLKRWWNMRSYPRELCSVLRPIESKIIGAITIRAKMNQQSQELLNCLGYVVQDANRLKHIRTKIADNTVLKGDIDDWLRGKERAVGRRSMALRKALKGAGGEDADHLVGNLLLLTNSLAECLRSRNLEDASGAAVSMSNRVQAAALLRNLRVEGKIGEVVEYNPAAHETVLSGIPVGQYVRLERPMVTRVREDETRDILIRAVVSEVQTDE